MEFPDWVEVEKIYHIKKPTRNTFNGQRGTFANEGQQFFLNLSLLSFPGIVIQQTTLMDVVTWLFAFVVSLIAKKIIAIGSFTVLLLFVSTSQFRVPDWILGKKLLHAMRNWMIIVMI